MEKCLLDLLHKNLYDVNMDHEKLGFKKGTFYDDKYKTVEFRYLKNLCLIKPEKFEITEKSDLLSKLCMMSSYNDFSCLEEGNQIIEHEIVGVLPVNSNIPVLHVKVNKSSLSDKFVYKTNKFDFDFKISKLTIDEQIILILHMIKVYTTETDLYSRKIKVNAYIDRLMFSENDKHPLITRICTYYDSIINNDYKGLERLLEEKYIFDLKDILKFTLIFKRDIEIQLAMIYYKCGYYEKARVIFKKYNLHNEEIECLISLKLVDEAVDKIKLEMSKINKEGDFDQKVLYCNLCIKLGWITENPEWFDEGHSVYSSYEPIEQKAIFYYKLKDFKKSKSAYEDALKIVPQNERILFAYASVKILLEEYYECIDIFKRLLEVDKRNPEYLRNLSLCYYQTNDINNCMSSLKQNAVCDSKSMEMYFKLVIGNNDTKEILWCISKLDDVRHIEPIIRYLISESIVSLNEVKEAFMKNVKLRDINFEPWK